ncbi:hypothetical protein QAD02_020390 [Eretmocerus hayati]|uniref:Uncharacterized protein n=1 Tax=Eretmocerus hayati TaxID=131215 RepID=A0ACC2PNI5_9HYME|nr:hypothetical protein QAD02_020390 [Eretmocerus hayati]
MTTSTRSNSDQTSITVPSSRQNFPMSNEENFDRKILAPGLNDDQPNVDFSENFPDDNSNQFNALSIPGIQFTNDIRKRKSENPEPNIKRGVFKNHILEDMQLKTSSIQFQNWTVNYLTMNMYLGSSDVETVQLEKTMYTIPNVEFHSPKKIDSTH